MYYFVLLFSSKCSVISCAILNKSKKKIEVSDGSEAVLEALPLREFTEFGSRRNFTGDASHQ